MVAYCKLLTTPESLDHAQMVEGHGGEQHLCTVGVAYLPCEQPPELPIVEEMWSCLNPEEVFRVCDTRYERRHHGTEDEEARHRCVGEA